LGKLLLMFFAGLEINLQLFRRARNRSIALGIATTVIPLVLGTVVGLSFGYAAIPAIVIGSLLASHTLLGLSIVSRLGLGSLEPVTVAVGATVISDTLSLVVFAICVSIYTTGFSPSGLALLLAEIAGYILLVLFGLSRLGAQARRERGGRLLCAHAKHHRHRGRACGCDPAAGHRGCVPCGTCHQRLGTTRAC
jgi:Kef-type K+ transport system membrane component KefB